MSVTAPEKKIRKKSDHKPQSQMYVSCAWNVFRREQFAQISVTQVDCIINDILTNHSLELFVL